MEQKWAAHFDAYGGGVEEISHMSPAEWETWKSQTILVKNQNGGFIFPTKDEANTALHAVLKKIH